MRRRDFINVIAGLAAGWPLAARAQQSAMPVIGFLDSGSSDGMATNLASFRQGLGEIGYIEGKNVTIDYLWAQGHYDRLLALAAELARRQVNVIAATRSSAPGVAAKAATSTIPIVFQTGGDPVNDGLVPSLNRPGGNVTGVTRLSNELIQKRFGLIAELVPKATTIALLVNPANIAAKAQVQQMQEPTRERGLKFQVVNVSTAADLDTAFADAARLHADVLVQAADVLFVGRREQIVALTMRHAIPTVFFDRESVLAGGLMSYAGAGRIAFIKSASYVGRILKGEKPADLPVLQPTKFELIINLRTAKALGINISPSLLARADEVIE